MLRCAFGKTRVYLSTFVLSVHINIVASGKRPACIVAKHYDGGPGRLEGMEIRKHERATAFGIHEFWAGVFFLIFYRGREGHDGSSGRVYRGCRAINIRTGFGMETPPRTRDLIGNVLRK